MYRYFETHNYNYYCLDDNDFAYIFKQSISAPKIQI